MSETLNPTNFMIEPEKKWTEQFLSDVIERAALSESELQRFEKIFTKTESIVKFKNQEE